MGTSLFSIENLVCSYDLKPENKVLSIDKLEIPSGKLVFLLGASGCGKSTLLETLGLMNNTVASGNIFLNPKEGVEKINLAHLWKDEDVRELTRVRKDYYSFIFQNTNLMENFTAYENVCLSGMIKEEVTQEKVLDRARGLMEKIRLPETEVNLQTLAVNLSGGQRQRLAFVRALNNSATILFGDEPTGNLDEANANELFEIIRSNLNRSLSAIVVSHDINLAVKYADQIIVITKENGRNFGEVKPENVFNRSSWEGQSAEQINALKNQLRAFYKTDNERKQTQTVSGKEKSDVSLTYRKLFFKKEGKALLGKKRSNFFILSIILMCTFLAIGFANGSLDYLNKQLKDAFVNWIPISIPSSQSSELNNLVDDLGNEELKNKYFIKKATPYRRSPVRVWDPSKKNFLYALSRTVDVLEDGELIRGNILKKDNIVRGKLVSGFRDERDIGVIVTQKFLDEFSYPEDANFIYLPYMIKDTVTGNEKDIPVQVPVRAVVKRLPGKYAMVYPLFFWQSLVNNSDKIFDSTTQVNYYHIFFETDDKAKADAFGKSLDQYIASAKELQAFFPRPSLQNVDTVGFKAGYRYEIGFDSSVTDLTLLNNLVNNFKRSQYNQYGDKSFFRFFDYSSVTDYLEVFKYDELSVYFTNLKGVAPFKDYLYNRGDARNKNDIIQLDDAKVKEKENYLFLSIVTYIISSLLIVFSTLAVCLFIFNLLKSHLSKVKMNIGTFKAIGLTDKESRAIYFNIIIYFIAISVLVSFIAAALLGMSINYLLISSNDQSNAITYFKILDPITLATVLVIFVSTGIISRQTIRRILSKTPGDLIYNR